MSRGVSGAADDAAAQWHMTQQLLSMTGVATFTGTGRLQADRGCYDPLECLTAPNNESATMTLLQGRSVKIFVTQPGRKRFSTKCIAVTVTDSRSDKKDPLHVQIGGFGRCLW